MKQELIVLLCKFRRRIYCLLIPLGGGGVCCFVFSLRTLQLPDVVSSFHFCFGNLPEGQKEMLVHSRRPQEDEMSFPRAKQNSALVCCMVVMTKDTLPIKQKGGVLDR